MSNLPSYTTPSGHTINLRFIQKDDAALLVDFFHQLSPETKRLRFHAQAENVSEDIVWQEAKRLSDLDPQWDLAIAATINDESQEQIVGVARFARTSVEDSNAEFAIVVRDDFQRKGLGSYLLKILSEKAKALGVTHFWALVTADNIPIMKMIEKWGLNVETDVQHGQTKIRIALS